MNATNKITVDCNGDENKALAEKISRAEPGDQIEFGKITATLDEYQNGVAVLSITSIPVSDEPEAEVVEAAAPEAAPEASVTLFKNAKPKKAAPAEAQPV